MFVRDAKIVRGDKIPDPLQGDRKLQQFTHTKAAL
jgi:hypothetical protein